MSLWHIAWNYLWNRKLTTFLTIVSVALGVALITSVLLLHYETERRFVQEGSAFDVAVGPRGSTQQLVLSTIYFIGQPAGVMYMKDFEKIRKEPNVKAAFPINLGDSYKNFRIVGTTRDIFDFDWEDRVSVSGGHRTQYLIGEGKLFEKPMEAVIGSTVAADTQLKIGDTFASTHGMVESDLSERHEATPYTVVGICKPSGTPNDRAIFCDYHSIYAVHEHEYSSRSLAGRGDEAETPSPDAAAKAPGADPVGQAPHADEHDDHNSDFHASDQLTAVLLVLDTPAERPEFVQKLLRDYQSIVACIPVIEIQRLYNELLGTARQVMIYIGFLVMIISSISILIGLYLSIIQRKRDLAIMRALGASSGEVFGAVLIEAFWVTLLGILSGYALGLAMTWAVGAYLVSKIGFTVSVFSPTPDMISAYSAILVMGMFAGILPAWQAYRTDIARDLAEL